MATDDRFRLQQQARKLRRDATGPERALWARLRLMRRLGLRFRRQHVLPPYILDFYCPSVRLAVEVDGRTHRSDESREYDAQRDDAIRRRGITTLRVTNDQVLLALEDVCARIRIEAARLQGLLLDGDGPVPAADTTDAPQELFDYQ